MKTADPYNVRVLECTCAYAVGQIGLLLMKNKVRNRIMIPQDVLMVSFQEIIFIQCHRGHSNHAKVKIYVKYYDFGFSLLNKLV